MSQVSISNLLSNASQRAQAASRSLVMLSSSARRQLLGPSPAGHVWWGLLDGPNLGKNHGKTHGKG
jgi:hypothetical protein